MTYANLTERQALISGLRALAGLLESNPDVPASVYADVLVFPPHASDTENHSAIAMIASLIGPGTHTPSPRPPHTTTQRVAPTGYRPAPLPPHPTTPQGRRPPLPPAPPPPLT